MDASCLPVQDVLTSSHFQGLSLVLSRVTKGKHKNKKCAADILGAAELLNFHCLSWGNCPRYNLVMRGAMGKEDKKAQDWFELVNMILDQANHLCMLWRL